MTEDTTRRTRDAIDRLHRGYDLSFRTRFAPVVIVVWALIATLPIHTSTVTSALYPTAIAPPAAILRTDIDRARLAAIEARTLASAVAGQTAADTASELAARRAILDRIEAEDRGVRQGAARIRAAELRLTTASVLFFAALGVALIGHLGIAIRVLSAIETHNSPRRIVGPGVGTILSGAAAAALALSQSGWTLGLPQRFVDALVPDRAPIAFASGLAGLVILLMLTQLNTWTFASNWPRHRVAVDVRRLLVTPGQDIPTLRQMCKTGPKVSDDGPKVWREVAPAVSMRNIRQTCIPVVIVMALGLLALALTVEVAALRTTGGRELPQGVAQLGNAWLISTGVLFSAAVALCYAIPALRVAPYAAATERPATSDALKFADRALDRMFPRGNAPGPLEEDPPGLRALICHIGAGETKFRTILDGATQISMPHDLLGDTLTEKGKVLLTLLTPALGSGLLAVLT